MPPRDDPCMTQLPPSAAGSPQLRLLGDPALVGADGSIKSLERRAAGLLALVALEPGVTRARASALLWPESDNARQALRQQIARFRKNYGADLIAGTDALFIAQGVLVDAQLSDAGALQGDLLGELAFDDCEDFAEWLAQQRAQRRSGAASGLLQQIAAAEAQGDLEAATRLAEQLLLADNDSEAHHRTLMRLHYLRGDIAQAQAGYERLARLLTEKPPYNAKVRFDPDWGASGWFVIKNGTRDRVENGVRLFSSSTCHHRPEVYGGIGEESAGALLRAFFAEKR